MDVASSPVAAVVVVMIGLVVKGVAVVVVIVVILEMVVNGAESSGGRSVSVGASTGWGSSKSSSGSHVSCSNAGSSGLVTPISPFNSDTIHTSIYGSSQFQNKLELFACADGEITALQN